MGRGDAAAFPPGATRSRLRSGSFLRRLAPSLLGLLPGVLACGGEAQRPNLLLIVVDTLRADHLGCQGSARPTTPAIDALASSGVRFERAYTVAPWTMPSVASILSGLYPSGHGVIHIRSQLPRKLVTLPEILGEAGYATGAVVSHKLIGAKKHFDQGFESFDEEEARGHDHISTKGVTSRARAMLERLAGGGRPFFLFVHYFDPHYNFRAHPEVGFAAPSAGRLRGTEDIDDLRAILGDLTEEEVRFLVDLYDEEIRFTDDGIGSLLEGLRELGLDERTLVVLTADHGEEFLEHGWLGHTTTLYEELARVPLVVRVPGSQRAGAVVAEPVSTVALAPTILDLLGLDPSSRDFQARSFAPLVLIGAGGGERTIFCEVDFDPINPSNVVKTAHKRAIVRGAYKLVRDEETGAVELYDLERDPGERRNLASELPEVVERLEAALRLAMERAGRDALVATKEELTSEELEELRKLGYVGR